MDRVFHIKMNFLLLSTKTEIPITYYMYDKNVGISVITLLINVLNIYTLVYIVYIVLAYNNLRIHYKL